MTAIHESTDFRHRSELPRGYQDDVYRCCSFEGLEIEGEGLDGIVVNCTFRNSSWYWGLFNSATFVDVTFEGCLFRGTGFANCTFTRCRFINCMFSKDNLNGDCRFQECAWYDCVQSECKGLPRHLVPWTRAPR